MRNVLLGILAATVGSALPPISRAQTIAPADGSASTSRSDALDEIIVTAERRAADVQKTAVSVAVRNGDDLVREGKSTLAEILEDVPGVAVASVPGVNPPTDNPGASVVIRGVIPNAVLPGDTGVATTAIYTDGVYGGIGGDFDIDRLEVLRGPQGTLYGRSATSGVVSTYTRDPVLERWSADANLEYGSYALRHLSGAVNIPLNEQLAVRVSANDLYQNGFLGGNGGGSHQEDTGRIKVLYQPSQTLSLLVGIAIQADNVGEGGPSASLSAPNTFVVTPGANAPAVTDMFRQYWARLNWDLGFGTLTYIPALRTYSSDSPSVLNAVPIFLQDNTNNYSVDQIHTEEIRLASNSDSRVEWIAGAWFYDRLYDFDETVFWEPSGGFSHEPHTVKTTTNGALFGEVTLPLTESWRLTAGARYDYTRTDSQNSTYTFNSSEGSCNGVPFTPGVCTPYGATDSATWALPNNLQSLALAPGAGVRTQNNFTYKLRLEKDLTPANMVYGTASSGFLPGDLSVAQSSLTAGGPLKIVAFNYAPETLHSYEIGSKNRFLSNALQINGAVFYYDYSGYQQYVNINPGPAPDNVVTTSPARMFGAEFETLWQLTANDRLSLSGGYTDARYVGKPAFFATYVAQDKIPGVTPITLQARYDHRFVLPQGSTLSAGADAFFTSAYDEEAVAVASAAVLEPYVHSGSEVVANAHLTWNSSSGKTSVTGYVRNIANTQYKTGIIASIQGPTAVASVAPSAPRVFGIVVSTSAY